MSRPILSFVCVDSFCSLSVFLRGSPFLGLSSYSSVFQEIFKEVPVSQYKHLREVCVIVLVSGDLPLMQLEEALHKQMALNHVVIINHMHMGIMPKG